ncbi:putative protein phosphatase 2C 25 [Tasmannia lanceolata]|uniref:putative protein phosphatase 2C 25 n=1 Tax=Tasmannia lanceolata TaxID=3420 RepID=UPI0040644D74
MSCAVSMAGSPVFSPSRASLLCKTSSSETLILAGSSSPSANSPSLSPSCSFSSFSCSSPSSFRFRLQKQVSGIRVAKNEDQASSVAVLKRKRPPRIYIPPLSLLSPPAPLTALEENVEEVEVETDRFSVFCKKGRREVMEDRHSAVVDLLGEPKQAFFGVFDGHGGATAAEFAVKNMDKNVMDEVIKREDEEIEEAVKSGYLTTDMEFLKEEVPSGTCCVTALIRNGDLIVSNAGDCRAVISRGGVAEALTIDHRPSRKDERDRIEGLGGYVNICHGVWRIEGTLAVSRGIGDLNLKQWVTAEPETRILRIEPDCEFLILASDGLWDTVSNQEAIDMARPSCVGTSMPTALSACKKLANLSVTRGSADDITVMIILLGHFI